jgi:hypothetical protein
VLTSLCASFVFFHFVFSLLSLCFHFRVTLPSSTLFCPVLVSCPPLPSSTPFLLINLISYQLLIDFITNSTASLHQDGEGSARSPGGTPLAQTHSTRSGANTAGGGVSRGNARVGTTNSMQHDTSRIGTAFPRTPGTGHGTAPGTAGSLAYMLRDDGDYDGHLDPSTFSRSQLAMSEQQDRDRDR